MNKMTASNLRTATWEHPDYSRRYPIVTFDKWFEGNIQIPSNTRCKRFIDNVKRNNRKKMGVRGPRWIPFKNGVPNGLKHIIKYDEVNDKNPNKILISYVKSFLYTHVYFHTL